MRSKRRGTISEILLYPNVLNYADVTTLTAYNLLSPPPPAITGYVDGDFESAYAGIGQVCNAAAGNWVLTPAAM